MDNENDLVQKLHLIRAIKSKKSEASSKPFIQSNSEIINIDSEILPPPSIIPISNVPPKKKSKSVCQEDKGEGACQESKDEVGCNKLLLFRGESSGCY